MTSKRYSMRLVKQNEEENAKSVIAKESSECAVEERHGLFEDENRNECAVEENNNNKCELCASLHEKLNSLHEKMNMAIAMLETQKGQLEMLLNRSVDIISRVEEAETRSLAPRTNRQSCRLCRSEYGRQRKTRSYCLTCSNAVCIEHSTAGRCRTCAPGMTDEDYIPTIKKEFIQICGQKEKQHKCYLRTLQESVFKL